MGECRHSETLVCLSKGPEQLGWPMGRSTRSSPSASVLRIAIPDESDSPHQPGVEDQVAASLPSAGITQSSSFSQAPSTLRASHPSGTSNSRRLSRGNSAPVSSLEPRSSRLSGVAPADGAQAARPHSPKSPHSYVPSPQLDALLESPGSSAGSPRFWNRSQGSPESPRIASGTGPGQDDQDDSPFPGVGGVLSPRPSTTGGTRNMTGYASPPPFAGRRMVSALVTPSGGRRPPSAFSRLSRLAPGSGSSTPGAGPVSPPLSKESLPTKKQEEGRECAPKGHRRVASSIHSRSLLWGNLDSSETSLSPATGGPSLLARRNAAGVGLQVDRPRGLPASENAPASPEISPSVPGSLGPELPSSSPGSAEGTLRAEDQPGINNSGENSPWGTTGSPSVGVPKHRHVPPKSLPRRHNLRELDVSRRDDDLQGAPTSGSEPGTGSGRRHALDKGGSEGSDFWAASRHSSRAAGLAAGTPRAGRHPWPSRIRDGGRRKSYGDLGAWDKILGEGASQIGVEGGFSSLTDVPDIGAEEKLEGAVREAEGGSEWGQRPLHKAASGGAVLRRPIVSPKGLAREGSAGMGPISPESWLAAAEDGWGPVAFHDFTKGEGGEGDNGPSSSEGGAGVREGGESEGTKTEGRNDSKGAGKALKAAAPPPLHGIVSTGDVLAWKSSANDAGAGRTRSAAAEPTTVQLQPTGSQPKGKNPFRRASGSIRRLSAVAIPWDTPDDIGRPGDPDEQLRFGAQSVVRVRCGSSALHTRAPTALPCGAEGREEGGDGGGLELELALAYGFRQDLRPSQHVLRKPYRNVEQSFALHSKQLGAGQFGTVRACKELASGQVYACKSICKSRIKCESDAEDLRKEVSCLVLLRGKPHITGLKATFEDDEAIHLIMDLCRGGDLFSRIAGSRGPLTEKEAAELCVALVGALAECHRVGIVHRDVKPENILLARKNDVASVKLTDFGVATFLRQGSKCTEAVGTVEYMAPEVIRQSYGPEADVWSVGVVMYVALCRVPPFWASDQEQVVDAILHRHVSFTSPRWTQISAPCKDLIGRMLNKDPRQRITIPEILDHDWVRSFSGLPTGI